MHDILFNPIMSYIVYTLILIIYTTSVYFSKVGTFYNIRVEAEIHNFTYKTIVFILLFMFSIFMLIIYTLYTLIYLKYFHHLISLSICLFLMFPEIRFYIKKRNNFNPKYKKTKKLLLSFRFVFVGIISLYAIYFIQELMSK